MTRIWIEPAMAAMIDIVIVTTPRGALIEGSVCSQIDSMTEGTIATMINRMRDIMTEGTITRLIDWMTEETIATVIDSMIEGTAARLIDTVTEGTIATVIDTVTKGMITRLIDSMIEGTITTTIDTMTEETFVSLIEWMRGIVTEGMTTNAREIITGKRMSTAIDLMRIIMIPCVIPVVMGSSSAHHSKCCSVQHSNSNMHHQGRHVDQVSRCDG